MLFLYVIIMTKKKWWVQVKSVWFGFGKFSLKSSNFSIFFPLGGVKKYQGQRQDGLLFTVGQKYARDGSLPKRIDKGLSIYMNIFDDNVLQYLIEKKKVLFPNCELAKYQEYPKIYLKKGYNIQYIM